MTNFWWEESVSRVVTRQARRVTWAQLFALGASRSTIAGWTKSGYLTRVLPKVYAVGHTAPSREADLWAAVLYAGPGAMLSHASAVHHRGLIIYPPGVIHVSTAREKVKSIRGDQDLIAEVDGLGPPSEPAPLRKDRRKELTLREHGHRVVRYDWTLVKAASEQVVADLVRQGVGEAP
jgi:hypothetical protein